MRGAGERVGCRGLPGCSIMRAFLPFANIGVLCAAARSPCICSRLQVALPPSVATAHRADASLGAHGFAALANIGVLCAGRAQPLYLLTPSGRFGPLAQVPTGHTLPFGAPPGRFGPLAQQPTGHTLPCAPAGGWGSSRSLNRRGGRWPRPPLVSLPRKYRRSVRWPRTAIVFAHAFRSLWASGPTAHRADAPLRCPKNLCRSTKRERCERPKGARNAARPTFPKVPPTPLCLHQKKPPAPHKRERAATRPAGSIRQTDSPWDRAATRAGCRRCP